MRSAIRDVRFIIRAVRSYLPTKQLRSKALLSCAYCTNFLTNTIQFSNKKQKKNKFVTISHKKKKTKFSLQKKQYLQYK